MGRLIIFRTVVGELALAAATTATPPTIAASRVAFA
jgi:hypothetical protein